MGLSGFISGLSSTSEVLLLPVEAVSDANSCLVCAGMTEHRENGAGVMNAEMDVTVNPVKRKVRFIGIIVSLLCSI